MICLLSIFKQWNLTSSQRSAPRGPVTAGSASRKAIALEKKDSAHADAGMSAHRASCPVAFLFPRPFGTKARVDKPTVLPPRGNTPSSR